MRVNGQWSLCDDGEISPIVSGFVQAADGQSVEVPFLLDAGADRSVFSAQFLNRLRALTVSSPERLLFSGVGGQADSITVETVIGFKRDDGRVVTVRGMFGVFLQYESADLSVLGRDVTNNFSVIYDYPHQLVALLAPPHYCVINKTS